eukprot:sb/3476242/
MRNVKQLSNPGMQSSGSKINRRRFLTFLFNSLSIQKLKFKAKATMSRESGTSQDKLHKTKGAKQFKSLAYAAGPSLRGRAHEGIAAHSNSKVRFYFKFGKEIGHQFSLTYATCPYNRRS